MANSYVKLLACVVIVACSGPGAPSDAPGSGSGGLEIGSQEVDGAADALLDAGSPQTCGTLGSERACVCPDDASGHQVCEADGAWSSCVCAGRDGGMSDGAIDADGGPPDVTPGPDCDEQELSELYTRYVEPFVSGTVSSSCSQCHMTGIDLSLFTQDTPCQTMACMVELGAVSLEQPEQSTLLSQILMGDPSSSVFDVGAEHAAMLEWIEWSALCHDDVCGATEAACTTGTGAASTGDNPVGDCSEDDLLMAFWDSDIVDRQRCLVCHSDFGARQGTFGPCTSVEDCSGPQLCVEGTCRAPGPLAAPHFFEGVEGALDWAEPADRQTGLNTMYNIVSLGLLDASEPLASTLLTKPLLVYFQPTAIYGPGVRIESVPPGSGVGVFHGGTSKFNFGCHELPCPTSGVVDCRVEQRCGGDRPCPDALSCQDGYCRVPGSYCDPTYVNYVRFAEYFAECYTP